MGHSDVQVTMTYLKEFDNDELDKANRKLLDFTKLKKRLISYLRLTFLFLKKIKKKNQS